VTTVDLAPVGARLSGPERRRRLLQWVDLTRVLAVKNFRRRYLRSRLGVVWALLQPTMQAAVLSIVFLGVFHIKNIPHYPLYVLSGIMAWQFFQQTCNQGTSSIVDNGPLVRKVAVPKVIFPFAAAGGTLLVFLIQLVVLFVAAVISGTLGWSVGYLLLAVPLVFALASSVAVLFSSLFVSIRDVKFLVESGLMMFFYLTPVIYDISRLPEGARALMDWNPLYGVLSLMRAAFLGRPVDWQGVLSATILTVVIAAVGGWLFARRSQDFSDLV